MIYEFIDGTTQKVETIEIPQLRSEMFKVNLPASEPEYKKGNGEGVWACASPGTNTAHTLGFEDGVHFVKILNDSVYYPPLRYGTIIPIEMRGKYRPVALYKELIHKYGPCKKEEAMRFIQNYRGK